MLFDSSAQAGFR